MNRVIIDGGDTFIQVGTETRLALMKFIGATSNSDRRDMSGITYGQSNLISILFRFIREEEKRVGVVK